MQRVLVLDRNKKPLMPCHPARARQLLRNGKAAILRRFPFTIILKYREGGDVQDVRLKIDPGSKKTGIALVAECKRYPRVVWAGEIEHRGEQIKRALEKRRAVRRSRRNRKTRYRKARFLNRRRPEGWLPPSLESRIANIETWVKRLSRWSPVSALSLEVVRFDTQKLQNPEINGVKYQRGELFGYEIREYLLEKWGRKCAYCGKNNVPLEVEHIVPKSRGGSNRISNLTLACRECNIKKGNKTAEEFGYPEIQKQARRPLKDAAAINSIRWRLFERLKEFGFEIECGSGGRTKYNRIVQGYPKEHWVDAACVGENGQKVYIPDLKPLQIKAMGWGSRQMCRMDRYGFPRTSAKTVKIVKGFQTGDIVKAVVTRGKKIGTYIGRVAVRASGSFNIKTAMATIQGISWKYCQLLQRMDGYCYN
jgi:5-methylcytosine-specific restriction endonuclease McrA